MKINQRELEFKILKCCITEDTAVDIAAEKSLKEYHFLSKEAGSDISLTGKIYSMCQEYAAGSGGYKLTETVLENLLIRKGAGVNAQAKILNLWYEILETETSKDEFPYLIGLMKDRYCVRLMSEMTDKNAEFVVSDQIKESISSILDYVNIMTEEQEDFQKDKEFFDMADADEFFFKEYDEFLDNPDKFYID